MGINKLTDGTTDVFFFAIRGSFYGVERTLVAEDRQGEDGSARRLLGLKPRTFQLTFECHVDTYEAAKTLGLFLQQWKGHVLDVVQEGILNVNCLVLNYEYAEPVMHANMRKGIYPADGEFKFGFGAEFRAVMDFEYTDNH